MKQETVDLQIVNAIKEVMQATDHVNKKLNELHEILEHDDVEVIARARQRVAELGLYELVSKVLTRAVWYLDMMAKTDFNQ